jgi:competence protein ComEC
MDLGSEYEVLKSRKHETIKPGMTPLVPSVLLCWAVCAAGYLCLFQYKDADFRFVGFIVAVVFIASVVSSITAYVLTRRQSESFATSAPELRMSALRDNVSRECVLENSGLGRIGARELFRIAIKALEYLRKLFLAHTCEIFMALAFFALGGLLAINGASKVISFDPYALSDSQEAVFVLAEDAQSSTSGYKARAIYVEGVDESEDDSRIVWKTSIARALGKTATVTLYLSDAEGLLEGSIVRGVATFATIGDTYAQSMWQSGITYSATLSSYTEVPEGGLLGGIRHLRKNAIDTFAAYGGNQAGILQAIVCGYKNTIKDDGTYEKFKICGLAHLVAVSGAHLAIVSAAFAALLKLIGAPRRATFVAVSFFVCAYLVFAGVPISAIRASIMILLSMSAWIFSRRSASLNALAICILVFLLFDPVSSVSVSLFLSAASTLGIILFAGLIASWMPSKSKIVSDFVVAPVSLTFASNIETLPFSAAMFSQVSLVAPLANVIAAGFFTIACTVGLACAVVALAVHPIAQIAIKIASLCAWPLQVSVDILASIPYASIAASANATAMICLSVAVSVLLWKTFPKLSFKTFAAVIVIICACSIALVLVAPRLAADEIRMLDVGQGDSTLVRSQGNAVLIDTGNKDSLLREAIGESAIYELDGVFISHADSDHCESLESLASYVNIKAVYVASDLLNCACNNCTELVDVGRKVVGDANLIGLNKGDVVKVGRFSLEVVSPSVFVDEGGNADSLVLLCRYDYELDGVTEWSTLFTGDAEADVLQGLVDGALVGDIDILKVPHHGSKAGMTEELLTALSPEVALIGVGATNRYGHPTSTALELLHAVGSNVYRTDTDSCISIRLGKDTLSIQTDDSS